MRSPTLARISLLACVAALAAAAPAGATFDDTLRAAQRAISLARTPEAEQARYDAGRNLEEAVYSLHRRQPRCRLQESLTIARGLVREAEGYDHPSARLEGAGRRQAEIGVRRLRRCPRTDDLVRLRRHPRLFLNYPPLGAGVPEGATHRGLRAKLARLGRSFDGWAAVWTHDLLSGRTAGWNSDARFPAASTVKLGVLLAALKRVPAFGSPLDYDLRAMTGWSSNLAANRIVTRIGGPGAVEAAMRRAGATRSSYPQGFRAGTAVRTLDVEKEPPAVSGRVTTAHDLGRMLYTLQSGALRQSPRSLYGLVLLLRSQPTGNNVGLLRPWLPRGTPIAQKNGWLHDARHTAAIVYFKGGPKIVVVLTYAPNLELAKAREFGRRVLQAVR